MPPEYHVNPVTLDLNHIVADKEAIRRLLPQRFEMEQIDAVVYEDPVNHIIAGFKDVRSDEFWVRGHMPDYPLMPGVLMCEAGAQLCGFYITKHGLLQADFIAFGGMENVRFRSPVHPGDRLILIGKGIRLHRRHTIFNIQGFVGPAMAFHADILGVPMNRQGEA